MRPMPPGGISSAYLTNARLQPLRGVITLDRLTLYDHGGVTAFDAAGGRGDGAGDVAGGQHHRETDSQRRQQQTPTRPSPHRGRSNYSFVIHCVHCFIHCVH